MLACAISIHMQAMQPGRCFGLQILQLTAWTKLSYQPEITRQNSYPLVITQRP